MHANFPGSPVSAKTWSNLSRRHLAIAVVMLLCAALLAVVTGQRRASAAGSSCGPTINPVVCENSQTSGVASESVWDVNGVGDASIQGFSTDISVNAGNSINFKIKTAAPSYTIDIYRLGYYGGNGARRQAPTINVTNTARNQPSCLTDPSTSLVDCGNWAVSASWPVPSAAVSGVYIALLTRTDTGGQSQITFVVRNDASTSDIIYQTSDETWQAYNRYGDYDFYTGSLTNLWDSPSRARKLSYNRPFATRDDNNGRDFLFSNEYPTIRFLEQNGYDVSYLAGVDADRFGSLLTHHKVYMDVGHDEYVSGAQRANVLAARDTGVNLMFLSGNEVYWHTRFESSIDGSNTAYRTLVCYKETWDNAATDPTGTSTATWRDPRFGAAPGGSNPENALTGTMYFANSDDLPITVTKAQGKTRLWRGSGLSSMTGASTQLAPHTVGYESDEDRDNGFRPAGLVDLSTTVGSTPQLLTDFGNTVVAGTTTHHLTLYRAGSGALVFAAGTIQWGWGLDSDHDGTQSAADPRMRQATVNMLADMKTQPSTLASGLVAATASTDTQAPTSVITSPASGSAIANGTKITVTGTAVDSGGGQVAGVEVSIDSGATWHPATGTTSWSYTGVVHGNSSTTIKSRASDDSANLETPSAGVTVTTKCPCSLFGNTTPSTPNGGDASATELGVRFTSSTSGAVTGIRFYKASTNTGTHTGTLWSASGTQLATGTFTGESASGWQTLQFATPVNIAANTTYVASYFAPNGHYSEDGPFFYYRTYDAAPLHAQANSPTTSSTYNGVFFDGHGFPDSTYLGANYYVDVVFSDTGVTPPTVTSQTPAPGATGVTTSVAPTATFSKAVTSSSIVFTLKNAAGANVAGTVSYATGTNTATFTPGAALASGTTYTASVTATDTTGVGMTQPATWTFTTAGTPACPCTLFATSATPTEVDSADPNAVNLGVRFVPSVSGFVAGVRFYKATTNTGTHTGALWSSTGTQLATGTFSGETASGWQTLQFASPVAVTGGTTYVVSYFAPNGHYSNDSNFFATAFTNGPLTAPASTNGVYMYGSSAAFPSLTYNATNYWVDPIFTTNSGPDTTPPTVTSQAPAQGSGSVSTSAAPSAVFSEPVTSASIAFTLKTSSGASVAGTVSYNSTTLTATFTPTAALASSTTYTASVSASDTAGNAMTAPSTWSFTTAGSGACPCTLFATNATPTTADSGDPSAVNLGVRFVPSVDGQVTGVRFYKAATNTGTHTGALWSSTGAQLATGTFTGETATGWQTLQFATPVSVTAGATYTVSYRAPSGHYSDDQNFFTTAYTNGPLTAPAGSNGVYLYGAAGFPSSTYQNTNYWVDPIFTTTTAPGDTTPPTVTARTPASGATGVATDVAPTATFSEAVTSASIVFTVKNGAGTAVAGAVSYNGATATATFTPSAALAASTVYTASVSASDTAGNAMTSPSTWSFTTAAAVDTTPPTVTARTPASGATGVATDVAPTATFSEAVTSASVVFTVKNAAGTAVAGAVSYSSATATATFTPSAALAASTVYTASVSASDTAGNAMTAPSTWSFTTAAAASCPCTLFASGAVPAEVDSGDPSAVNLGVKFVSSVNGYVTGVRFYKAATNTGTHTGTLWSSTGTQLATGTFSGETASGWQTLQFPSAVAVTAGTTYVVGYYAPNGHYSDDGNYFASAHTNGPLTAPSGTNGVYLYGTAGFPNSTYASTNYWVDPIFTTTAPVDTTPPTVTARTPASGATGVATDVAPTATFSEAVTSASVVFTVKNAAGTAVAGAVTYSSATLTATFTPTAALAAGTTYTASVSASDTAGNAMTAPSTWSFTTASAASCPCTLFAAGAVPAEVDSADGSAVTLGVKFVPSVNGYVTGVRFYKATTNTGTHTGTLWSSTGTQLATGTFSGETASGWQTLQFSGSIAVTAGTTYVVGYYAPNGHYSDDGNYFASAHTNGPLTAPSGTNGVYKYGTVGFPNSTYASTNYWVDPIFATTPA